MRGQQLLLLRRGLVLAFLLLLAPAAWAQSGIAGVVRDATGGVLPGVTVEARSPVLIEQVRTVYTDGQGLYRIIDLRPGTYSVTFTLPGFRTVVREGVELPAAFTATINADLTVGGLEETLTVTGAAPTVDTQSVIQRTQLSREVRDAIPLPSNSGGFNVLIPSAVLPATDRDVGGLRGESGQDFTIHGNRNNDFQQLRDGMDFGQLMGGGNRASSINPASVQEFIVLTAGTAQAEAGGVAINTIPRDGGNTFSGTFQGNWTSADLQGNNIDDTLEGRGATSPGDIKKLYDVGFGVGGPIAQNKIWFFASGRSWVTESYIPGNFYNAVQGSRLYRPDTSRRAYENNFYKELNGRVTWQASERNKIAVTYIRDDSCQCHFGQRDGTRSPESAGSNHFIPNWRVQAKWTFPMTSRLMLSAGGSLLGGKIDREATGGGPDDYFVTDLNTNYTYGHHGRSFGNPPAIAGYLDWGTYNQQVDLNYVTGSHALVVGLQHRYANRTENFTINHGTTLGLRGDVPAEVTLWTSPFANEQRQRMLALYAQDQWTLDRLTLNLGVRLDTFKGWVPPVAAEAAQFELFSMPERNFAAVDDALNWKDINPRIGAAYDLFGTGRTAVKGFFGRFIFIQRHQDISPFSPAAQVVRDADRSWNDLNGDLLPQENELGPISDENFGSPVAGTEYDRAITHGWHNRDYSWQGSLSVEHELAPNVAVEVGYYRTWYGNFRAQDNTAVTPADYDQFTYTSPMDPDLPDGGGDVIGPLFNVNPAAFGNNAFVVVPASNFGKQSYVYNGVDVNMRGRFGNGIILTGGISVGRSVSDVCDVVEGNPQLRVQTIPGNPTNVRASTISFCKNAPPWSAGANYKVSGVLPLAYGVQLSGTYQNLPGIATDASFVLGPTAVQGQLGRRLTGGGADRTIQLVDPGSYYPEGRGSQLDFRVSKRFQVGGVRIEPQLNLYNALNANDVIAVTTRYGPAWENVANVLPARLIKLGVQVDF